MITPIHHHGARRLGLQPPRGSCSLQVRLNKIHPKCLQYVFDINIAETKLMIFSRAEEANAILSLNDVKVDRVQLFKYLDSETTNNLDPGSDVG